MNINQKISVVGGKVLAWLVCASVCVMAAAATPQPFNRPVRANPPRVDLIAVAEGTNAIGVAPQDDRFPDSKPLQVVAGSRVELRVGVQDALVSAGRAQLAYQCRQLSGPAVNLTGLTRGDPTPSLSTNAQFVATAPGVYAFDCQVKWLDLNGVPTGQVIGRRIRIVAVRR